MDDNQNQYNNCIKRIKVPYLDEYYTSGETGELLAEKADLEHTHQISDVSGLTESLDNKADIEHTHQITDVSGLTEALENKANLEHTHQISDISGLSENYYTVEETNLLLDEKQNVLTAGNNIEISGNTISTTGVVTSQYITAIWRGTQQEYDALQTYDNNTLYVIVGQQ